MPCSVISKDLRVEADGLYTYPDIVVVCGEPEFAEGGNETLVNLLLLAEVLSPSTEAYDRGFKAAQYRKLPSLREYVIVSQDEPRIEVIRRGEDGDWRLSDYVGLDASCRLASIDCEIALADIYSKVVFSKVSSDAVRPSAGL